MYCFEWLVMVLNVLVFFQQKGTWLNAFMEYFSVHIMTNKIND